MSGFNLKEFLTKPRVNKQIGSFPLLIRLTGERWLVGRIQAVTAAICTASFIYGLWRQLAARGFNWGSTAIMGAAIGLVLVQQLYYTRKGQNYIRLLRAQYQADKERITYLKENYLG